MYCTSFFAKQEYLDLKFGDGDEPNPYGVNKSRF